MNMAEFNTFFLEKRGCLHTENVFTRVLRSSKALALIVMLAVLIGGCASPAPQPQLSEAALRQQTDTGVRIGPDSGMPTTPSVEYIRVRMTDTVFLDPPETTGTPGVYLRVRNTSGREGLDLQGAVARELQLLGYRLVNNSTDAYYIMQANVLFADEVSAAEIAKLDETQFGTDVGSVVAGLATGAITGALVGNTIDSTNDSAVVGAVAGALIGGFTAASKDQRRKDLLKAKQYIKYFSIVVDIQLRERSKGYVNIAGGSDASATRPSGGGAFTEQSSYSRQESQSYAETSDWKRYQTRVIGKAKGKLIVFDDVQNDFVKQLSSSLAGVL